MGLNHMRWARRKEPKCVSWTYKPPADDNMGFIVQPTWKCPRDQPPWVGFLHPELNMAFPVRTALPRLREPGEVVRGLAVCRVSERGGCLFRRRRSLAGGGESGAGMTRRRLSILGIEGATQRVNALMQWIPMQWCAVRRRPIRRRRNRRRHSRPVYSADRRMPSGRRMGSRARRGRGDGMINTTVRKYAYIRHAPREEKGFTARHVTFLA